MQIIKGVDLVWNIRLILMTCREQSLTLAKALNAMENFDHKLKLRSLVQDSSKSTELTVGSMRHATYSLDNSVGLVCLTLKELLKQVSEEPELIRGTKELNNFIQNLRISPLGPTADEHLQALYSIRH
jgi:hypothetical protein